MKPAVKLLLCFSFEGVFFFHAYFEVYFSQHSFMHCDFISRFLLSFRFSSVEQESMNSF